MTGKMSLVVLRSWTDGPPKVRAIAPPDDDRSVIIEPDHHGRFLTEEISEDDPRFNNHRERAASAGAANQIKRRKSQQGQGSGGGGGANGESNINKEKVSNGTGSSSTSGNKLPLFLRRRTGLNERNLVNRHSYSGVCDNNSVSSSNNIHSNGIPTSSVSGGANNANSSGEKFPVVGRSISTLNLSSAKVPPPDSLTIRSGSVTGFSPDHPNADGSSLEYTPPSSPVTGRYRNLGPELAATIPKRTIKSSWITGIKSRWMKSTTPPDSGRGSSTLKSYSSSPSLVTSISQSVLKEELLELDLEESVSAEPCEVNPFFNPLYKFTHHPHHHRINHKNKGNGTPNFHSYNQNHHNNDSSNIIINRNHNTDNNITPGGSHLPIKNNSSTGSATGSTCTNSSGIVLSADDDSQSDRSRSSLSNPTASSYSPSPPPPPGTSSPSPTANLRQQIVSNSSKPNGLQKYNSLTDFSEEDLYSGGSASGSTGGRSLTGSPYGLPSHLDHLHSSPSSASECVLVEVIRKPDSPQNANSGGNKNPVGIKAKRHSIGEVEPIISNKFAGVKVEGSPGKVARIKESIKKFGRFGRNHSEKVFRFQSDSDILKPDENTGCIRPSDVIKLDSNGKNSSDILLEKSLPVIKVSKSPEHNTSNSKTATATDLNNIENSNQTLTTNPTCNEPEPQKPQEQSRDNYENQSSESEQNQDSKESSEVSSQSPPTKQTSQANQSMNLNDDHNHRSNSNREVIKHNPNINISSNEGTPCEELESVSSITGDLDRSISSHIHAIPTIDIESCAAPSVEEIDDEDEDFPVLRSSTSRTPSPTKEDILQKIAKTSVPSGLITKKPYEGEDDIDIGSTNKLTHNTEGEIKNISFTIEDDALSGSVSLKEDLSRSSSSEMFRQNGRGGISFNSIVDNYLNNSNNLPSANSHKIINGQIGSGSGSSGVVYNGVGVGNVKAAINHFSPSPSPLNSDMNEQKRIGHGKNSRQPNGVASVQVPVQAINRHVVGYGLTGSNGTNNLNTTTSISSVYANSIDEDDRGSGSQSAASSSGSRSDSDWQRSSTRASFRGFCEGLLQDEKIAIEVPEVVEASINFDNEDSSSLDPDEERENSVEYISIADVKVNHERKSNRAAISSYGDDREPLPSCVISLDIGSRGSGYSYWIREESDCVRIGNVDTGSQCPKSHKSPSWVSVDDLYLDVEDDEEISNNSSSPGFGYQALDKFLSDNSQSHQLFWKWRENFNEGSTYPYTLESKPNEEELQLTMKSAIRHYATLALDQVGLKKRGGPSGSIVILVAIPSNFDARSRQLVRDAAFGSGLVTQKDALALIEDPCAAGIYAYHAIKSKISKMNNHEISYLSVDVGGVYLHSSGYEISGGKLHLILSPKSVPLVDSPESLFEAELSSIFTPSFIFNYQNKYKAGWLKLMTEFDRCKNLYDPMQRGNYHVFVPSSFVDHFRRFTSMEVEDALESSDILWSKVGALGIPYWKMQRFIQPMMDFVKDQLINLIKKHNYEFLVLTGGRAGSRHLVDFVKNAVRDFSVDLVVPKEFNAAVLQGSTISLTNLAPRLIIKSPFSIGVGVMTPFNEEQHPEEKRVMRDGKSWCADVWDSLIKVGQDLELNRVILKRSYVGAQPGQSLLILPLFKSPLESKFVTESSVEKCCEFKFNSGQRAWQEVELVIKCRPSELLISALDAGVMKNVVVVDFAS